MILLFYILLALIAAARPSGELDGGQDWSQCPPACKCKWASGKRTADCEGAGLDSLPLFPRPDLIQVLVMDHNPLKTLPPKAFHLTGLINVQKVFMKNCSLHDLDPTALGGLVILIELDLSDNHIKELKQGTFRVCSNFSNCTFFFKKKSSRKYKKCQSKWHKPKLFGTSSVYV